MVMALASGVGEELFFRGCLTPLVGVFLSSAAFGVLHQVRGRARWAWAGWATVMGLAFATIYELTGHLVGPILAHVTINLVNLRYLRDHDPEAKPRTLGGLLARRARRSPREASHRRVLRIGLRSQPPAEALDQRLVEPRQLGERDPVAWHRTRRGLARPHHLARAITRAAGKSNSTDNIIPRESARYVDTRRPPGLRLTELAVKKWASAPIRDVELRTHTEEAAALAGEHRPAVDRVVARTGDAIPPLEHGLTSRRAGTVGRSDNDGRRSMCPSDAESAPKFHASAEDCSKGSIRSGKPWNFGIGATRLIRRRHRSFRSHHDSECVPSWPRTWLHEHTVKPGLRRGGGRGSADFGRGLVEGPDELAGQLADRSKRTLERTRSFRELRFELHIVLVELGLQRLDLEREVLLHQPGALRLGADGRGLPHQHIGCSAVGIAGPLLERVVARPEGRAVDALARPEAQELVDRVPEARAELAPRASSRSTFAWCSAANRAALSMPASWLRAPATRFSARSAPLARGPVLRRAF